MQISDLVLLLHNPGIPVLDYAALPPFSRTGDSAATTGNSGISS